MTAPKVFKRSNKKRTSRAAKNLTAREAIGELEHDQDVFILTFGQFSLIDALIVILEQTGPADVTVSTWTAADAHLQKTAAMIEGASIRSFKMIVDRSFETRQPAYCNHMRSIFGDECIRAIRTHAKFMLVRNERWDVVVRTSMNLNENPRLENLEISESREFAAFFQTISDEIFREVAPGQSQSQIPVLDGVPQAQPYQLLLGDLIPRENTKEVKTTHVY